MEFTENTLKESIVTKFEKIVDCYSDRQAVKVRESALTYRKLNQAANQLAYAILAKIGQREEPIVLICEHDASVIIGLLGVLKTGRCYVPLGADTPEPRLNYIIENLATKLIITDSQNLALAQQLVQNLPDQSISILNVNQIDQSYDQENLNLAITPTSLACILYTSGSTGLPKGVMRDHQMILNMVFIYTNKFQLIYSDRLSMLTLAAFGGATTNIFNALLNGATLCFGNVVEQGLYWLSQWLIDEKITILRLPVILFHQWLEILPENAQFPDLRYIAPSGKFYQKDTNKTRMHVSNHCCLVQQLATTEAGVITILVIDPHPQSELTTDPIPVGYAVDGKAVFLVDESGAKVDCNKIGEIAVKSRYISQGYWRNPDLTKQKFLPSPDGSDQRIYFTGDLGRMQPDGCLEWIERKDFMLKIRGYRVEPLEVERALLSIVEIEQAVVVGVIDPSEETRLAAYIVLREKAVFSINMIRKSLTERLPSYLIPSKFMILESLPTTLNHRLDRSKLPAIDWNRPDLANPFVSPNNPLEMEILKIWQSVLRITQIGINDDFIELGGTSIQAMQIVARVLDGFHTNLSPNILLNSSTVAKMAAMIIESQIAHSDTVEMEAILREIEELAK